MDSNKIKEFEAARKGSNSKKHILGYLGIALLVIGLVVLLFSFIAGVVLVILGIALILVGFIGNKRNPVEDFKSFVINDLIKEICSPQVYYDRSGSISLSEVEYSNLLKMPDKMSGEDLIVDTYKNVRYEISDLSLQEARTRILPNGDSYTEYFDYFKGMFMVFDYPADLKGELYIVPKRHSNLCALDTIESESIELNEKYILYTTNKEYAFQILTPLCIEKILALNNIYKGIISYAFTVDKLYVAINSRVNFLDVPGDKPITEMALRKLESDLMLPQAIINEFKLDKGKFQNE